MTHGDIIRRMTNEELVEVVPCPSQNSFDCLYSADMTCAECVKRWLESEVEE